MVRPVHAFTFALVLLSASQAQADKPRIPPELDPASGWKDGAPVPDKTTDADLIQALTGSEAQRKVALDILAGRVRENPLVGAPYRLRPTGPEVGAVLARSPMFSAPTSGARAQALRATAAVSLPPDVLTSLIQEALDRPLAAVELSPADKAWREHVIAARPDAASAFDAGEPRPGREDRAVLDAAVYAAVQGGPEVARRIWPDVEPALAAKPALALSANTATILRLVELSGGGEALGLKWLNDPAAPAHFKALGRSFLLAAYDRLGPEARRLADETCADPQAIHNQRCWALAYRRDPTAVLDRLERGARGQDVALNASEAAWMLLDQFGAAGRERLKKAAAAADYPAVIEPLAAACHFGASAGPEVVTRAADLARAHPGTDDGDGPEARLGRIAEWCARPGPDDVGRAALAAPEPGPPLR
jgi:hypothetical protein